MFLVRCCLRRERFAPLPTGFANFRRFLRSRRQNQSDLPRVVAERAAHFVEHMSAHAIRRYFRENVLQDSVPREVRSEAANAVVELLFRRREFGEGLRVLSLMKRRDLMCSAPILAKALTFRYIAKDVRRSPYFHNMEGYLSDSKFSTEEGQRHLLDILHLLWEMDKPMEDLEKVTQIYLSKQSNARRLNSSTIAFMIKCHFERGHDAEADRWISYHSSRITPSTLEEDPSLCYPYTALLHGRLLSSAEKNPRKVYAPILKQMAEIGVQPDAVFMNVLVTANLRARCYNYAVDTYDVLRSYVSQGIYPDETTYSQLFSTSANLTAVPSKKARQKFGITPRQLFWEMMEVQLHVKKGNIPFVNSIITKESLGAAVAAFIANQDYAGAIVVLKTFELLHVPLDRQIIDIFIKSIVLRCRLDLEKELRDAKSRLRRQSRITAQPSVKKSWAQIFLDLRELPKTEVRLMSETELTRRILNVSRRALLMTTRRLRQAEEELEEKKPARDVKEGLDAEAAQASAESSSRTHEQGSVIDSDDFEASETGEQQSSAPGLEARMEDEEIVEETANRDSVPLRVRDRKRNQQRELRFRLLDVMLSRALETSIVLEQKSFSNYVELAVNAVGKAFEEMIPPITKVTREALKRMQAHRRGAKTSGNPDAKTDS